MAYGLISRSLLVLAILPFASASSNNTLQIYNTASLANVSASRSCVSALAANLTCYDGLGEAVTQATIWSSGALDLICADTCKQSLNDYVTQVNTACGSGTMYNISGTEQDASLAGQKMQWKQNATCLTDPSTGKYCNTMFQDSAKSSAGSNMTCNDCTLHYLTTLANSQWGQQMIDPSMVASRISSCSAGATYTVTATTSTSSVSTSATATSMVTSNARCNTSDPDARLYTVQSNQTCVGISSANNVSTPALKNMNALDTTCSHLFANQTLCLPSECAIHKVKTNETCSSIVSSLDHEISTATFRSWNPSIMVDCSNIDSYVGDDLCISPPGTLSIPDSFPLAAATTKVAVPTDAVTSSNTDCGHWYKIQSGDNCQDIESQFDISAKDLFFLNPQLNNTCDSLWVNNSYCVQPVGNIKNYTGYTTSKQYTTLANTINTNATQTVNRTTTHFFYSFPAVVTTTSTYNSSAYELTNNYTLCDKALAYYNITSYDQLDDSDDPAWMSEYQRVCVVDVDAPLPTIPFNTSVPFSTSELTSSTAIVSSTPSRGATAGATSTISQATSTLNS